MRAARVVSRAAGSRAVVHDAVVAAAGAGAAGAGAVAGEHLGGGPAVEFHEVPFGAAAVQPGVAEMVPEPVRVHPHPALPAAAGDDLVDAARGQRSPAVYAEPQLRPPGLRVPGAGPQVAVQAAGRLVADLDGPGCPALAADPGRYPGQAGHLDDLADPGGLDVVGGGHGAQVRAGAAARVHGACLQQAAGLPERGTVLPVGLAVDGDGAR